MRGENSFAKLILGVGLLSLIFFVLRLVVIKEFDLYVVGLLLLTVGSLFLYFESLKRQSKDLASELKTVAGQTANKKDFWSWYPVILFILNWFGIIYAWSHMESFGWYIPIVFTAAISVVTSIPFVIKTFFKDADQSRDLLNSINTILLLPGILLVLMATLDIVVLFKLGRF